jgi:hypothetical protein
MYIDTARPSFDEGVNLICLAASTAICVKPWGSLFTTLMPVTSPEAEKTARSMTVP